MEKQQTKKKLLGLVALVAMIAIFAGAYFMFLPKTSKGAKEVQITVVNKAEKETVYKIHTDAEFLEEAMNDAKEEGLTFSGEESEYGLMVDTVNGETASYEKDKAYWAFYINGEYCNYGISEQPVVDKDQFEIRYTIGE